MVVDYEAGLAAEMHWMADAERLAHRHDQRLGVAWTPLGGDLLPIAVQARPGKGRVAVKGRLDKLIGDHTAAAVAYVRGHATELAPGLEPDWLTRNDLQIDALYGDVPADVTSENAGSAGLAIAAALVSLMSGRLVRTEVAVTGGRTGAGPRLQGEGPLRQARLRQAPGRAEGE